MEKKGTILAAGGTGFIGSHTVVELLEQGYGVVIVDNLYNSSADMTERINKITGKTPKFYDADVTDAGALRKVFSENDITAVMHFAGYKAVGESVQKPLEYYRNNLDTTLTLLEVMREYGVKNIIFSSSATVYGMDNVSPMNETMKLGECTNPYGWTKWMIERIMTDAAAADPELSVVLLRYFNPIGAHTSGLIGERPTGTPNNLMPYISQVASGRLEKLSIYGDEPDAGRHGSARLYTRYGPRKGPRRSARLSCIAQGDRSVQPRHRQRLQRKGACRSVCTRKRSKSPLRRDRTPRGRHSRVLR